MAEANDEGAAAFQPAGTDKPPTADASPRAAEAPAPDTEPTMCRG